MIADPPKVVATRLRPAIRVALIQQSILAVLCVLMMDGGRLAKICAAALIGYWLAVAWLMSVRPHPLSPVDFHFIRWGSVPLFFLAIGLAGWLVPS